LILTSPAWTLAVAPPSISSEAVAATLVWAPDTSVDEVPASLAVWPLGAGEVTA
jgi:hypothetical protein